jgi:hypothetical protein
MLREGGNGAPKSGCHETFVSVGNMHGDEAGFMEVNGKPRCGSEILLNLLKEEAALESALQIISVSSSYCRTGHEVVGERG